MKNTIPEEENPCTIKGLFVAIIEDFDIHQKIKFLEEQIIILNNQNLVDKGNMKKEDF